MEVIIEEETPYSICECLKCFHFTSSLLLFHLARYWLLSIFLKDKFIFSTKFRQTIAQNLFGFQGKLAAKLAEFLLPLFSVLKGKWWETLWFLYKNHPTLHSSYHLCFFTYAALMELIFIFLFLRSVYACDHSW